MFEGETFFRSILYKNLVSQTLEATDEVVSMFTPPWISGVTEMELLT